MAESFLQPHQRCSYLRDCSTATNNLTQSLYLIMYVCACVCVRVCSNIFKLITLYSRNDNIFSQTLYKLLKIIASCDYEQITFFKPRKLSIKHKA